MVAQEVVNLVGQRVGVGQPRARCAAHLVFVPPMPRLVVPILTPLLPSRAASNS